MKPQKIKRKAAKYTGKSQDLGLNLGSESGKLSGFGEFHLISQFSHL